MLDLLLQILVAFRCVILAGKHRILLLQQLLVIRELLQRSHDFPDFNFTLRNRSSRFFQLVL